MPHGDDTRLVDAQEASRLTGLSLRTIRRKVAAGDLPSVKDGTRRLIPVASLLSALPSDRRGTGDAVPSVVARDTAGDIPANVMTLIERLAESERERGRLESENARLRGELDGLRALPPGQDARVESTTAPGATEAPERQSETLGGAGGSWVAQAWRWARRR